MREYALNRRSVRLKFATNLVMGVLILSIGALCMAPLDDQAVSSNGEDVVYRSAGAHATGVSLIFNVYWGTDEVYRILDILAVNDAQATFFIGGCWADDNVDCLKAIYSAGHEIGNHGYFHKDQDKLDLVSNQKEIATCNRFIQLTLGKTPKLFAPPSGAYNDATLKAVSLLGMKTILWSKDTIDWRDKDAKLIYARATKNVQIGDFILMHPMKETADALQDILNYYKTNGLKTVTVSDNLQNKG